MAKRKRLEIPTEPVPADLETKSFPPRTRMPIAEVAGTTANQAALETVAREMTKAEEEGRIIKEVSVHAIHIQHLARDRMVICLLYTSPSPRDLSTSRMPSSA